MDDIFRKITELAVKNRFRQDDKFIRFSDQDYIAYEFNIKNFKNIGIKKDNKLAFVDGGSAEILKSSNFSLNLIRTYYTIYSRNKRIDSGKNDFYSLTYAKNLSDEIYYDTEIIGLDNAVPDKNDLLLSSLDETIKLGISRASISTIANMVRRFSEIKKAQLLIDRLNKNDIVILDGSLQCSFTNEKKYLSSLYEKAERKGIIICGLSKSTSLMTDKGNTIVDALNRFGYKGKWIYHPVADIKSSNHKAEMSFVKLHDKSKHIFRFEIYKKQKEHMEDVACMLASNSYDPVFIGYPYGLVEADRNARVSNNEREMMKTFFSIKFGDDWQKIQQSLSSVDAHEILDKVS